MTINAFDPEGPGLLNVFDISPVGMAITREDFKFTRINDTFCSMMGFSREELMALTFKDITHPDHLSFDLVSYQRLLAGEIPLYKTEKRYIRKDGQIIWGILNLILLPETKGEYKYVLAVVEEITTRKEAEEALMLSEEKYRLLFENLSYGFFMAEVITDHNEPVNFRILEVNRYVKDIIGKEPEELKGKTAVDVVPGVKTEIIRKLSMPALTGEPVTLETYSDILHKYLRIHSYCPLKGYFAAFYEDVTEYRTAEKDIRVKNEELHRLNAEKDKFFSIIAHDLKSPFHNFINLTRMMEEKFPSSTPEKNLEYIRMLGDSSVNLFRLLENLLDWAKLQRGMTTVNPVSLQLSEAVQSNLDMVSEQARKKNIGITMDVPDQMKVYADERMVDGILRNLLTNALKFTGPGGKIAITARPHDRTHVLISFRDTGIGMDREMLEGLFRIDVNTGRTGIEGEASSGLGLILCKEFVERNGGRIWVESKPGEGSEFSFTLPG